MKVTVKVRLVLRTFFCYGLAGLLLVFTAVPALILLAVLPPTWCYDNRLVFWFMDMLYKGVLGATLLPVSIEGKENIPNEPAIFVANHQSALDIVVLGSLLDGYPHLWYALSYYARFPVLGFFIRRLGVPVDRDNLTSAARSLIKGIKLIQGQRRHIIIFPEGGRFNDGTVHDFLRGFAVIARKTGRPVVPVFMPHNGKVYPPGSFFIYHHKLSATIGKSFFYGEDDTDALFCTRVHAWFVQADS